MVLTYNYDNSRPGKGETLFRELYEVNLTGREFIDLDYWQRTTHSKFPEREKG